MDSVAKLQQDLHFVRETVVRREKNRAPAAILYLWAVYVLVGYAMIDFAPKYCNWFFMIGGIAGGVLSGWLGRRQARREGERDRAGGRARFCIGPAASCSPFSLLSRWPRSFPRSAERMARRSWSS